ncbi:MAG TPA: amino acid permease [Candidatus Baltobacteraceae bacterium]|nr:amino acid permease [Candidatus Baltobacteraceae bacterium]
MIRGINLRGAVALNVITMIGIGPLVTIPLVLAQLAGPLALAGWIAGALVALCDGLVWAELGSRYPGSGGTYVYLREVFGPQRWGRLLAFLFNWQFLLFAPFLLASGYIGFTDYLAYLFPVLSQQWALHTAASMAVGVLVIVLLYRRITAVASIGSMFAVAAVGTLLIIIAACLSHADSHQAFALSKPVALGAGFFAGLGGALYITLYDYVGYSDAALLGDEVREPRRTIPAAIVISIVIVAVLYIALQVGILSVVPWQTLVGPGGSQPADAQYAASIAIAQTWGMWAARGVTILILVTAFASLFGNLAGFARIPFAAARDGAFFPAFGRLHPSGQFPHISLLVIGIASLAACFFSLGTVIAILTAGIVLIQSVAQIIALFVMRARGERGSFRMWLFPLPALIALAGWIYAFAYTGTLAIAAGTGWLAFGVIAYLVLARAQRAWPFAKALTAALLLAGILVSAASPARSQAQPPFFLYGATFFYERVPRGEWAAALQRYRAMGINTIDLYVMWNWHELRDGDFDFTGRTNPRRDLVGLLKLIHQDGFRLVLRPGPVIRNEWRNGGYPAWLLTRPQYRMPLRDVLEGRYPATATLQNEHSDAAAQEWMNNPLHMRYATRWLQRVLRVASPYRGDIVAVALDDDQGAYIDNDTWPGPHFHTYISYLASVVHHVYPRMPVFINTYEMKVTASAPVWAWGNWYQSDAYGIGEHDRTQLEFSTGLLQTQARRPIMVSEFQAGWLQDADQPAPRPADPANTTLALHTLLQMGAHGVVNFPVQDTLNPAGWEAPWTNAFYSWDAALSVELTPQARYAPTAAFGDLIRRYGAQLAQTHPAADAAIAYLTSAYDPARITNNDIAQIAQATMDAQRGCRIMRITCALVDLRYAPASKLASYPVLIVPPNGIRAPYIAAARHALATYRARGGRIVRTARAARIAAPAAGGIPNAVLLVSHDERFGFVDVVNYGRSPLHTRASVAHFGRFRARVPAMTIAARDALLVPLRIGGANAPAQTQRPSIPVDDTGRMPLRAGSFVPAKLPGHDAPVVYSADVYRDGYPAVVFENRAIRLVVSPCAGARAFVFEDRASGDNLFTTVGGLRDAWLHRLPPSPRDYIAKYTHPIATGTFNRCYSARLDEAALSARFAYSAPDAPPRGATFRKSITLDREEGGFTMLLDAHFPGAVSQRAQQLTSFAIPPGTRIVRIANAVGFFEQSKQRLVAAAWPPADVENALLDKHGADALLTLTYALGGTRATRYAVMRSATLARAQAELRAFANRP